MEGHSQEQETFSPRQLFVHFVAGTFVFATIASLAVLLSIGIDFLAAEHINPFIVYGLQIAEYVLFIVDLFLFIVFVLRTAWRTYRKL
jgi:hypothetical protein